MMHVQDFVNHLLRGGTNVKEAEKVANTIYKDKSLKMRAIYETGENTIDKRHFNLKQPSGQLIWLPPLPPPSKMIAEFV
jgi:hypothetical protein